ncbi:uncharacterized protein G2W53_004820 [Senna tora]|uniref:Uncharacterized protein n=1 Tax=Senna tora TaxID=362788 RepID=A0A835CJN6_9FABA|nr:uncharacterized protein G2W53_004814 [Senna tora]KAF7842520.1 uncharacterized protein G2W53_004818 [Senna tora]KAF7842522.1 uncharacterized protein G2W53_004820 [Senna tora]
MVAVGKVPKENPIALMTKRVQGNL